MKSVLIAFVAATLVGSAQATPARSVEANVVRSSEAPHTNIAIDPSFQYLGHTQSVVMNNRATAEQFWFGKIENGRIVRAAIVHFEHWNDGVEGAFNYPTFRMRRLGANEYLHQSFPIENCSLVTDDVRALLQEANAAIAPHCLATRFVRATTTDKRSEIILFFVEPTDAVDAEPEGLGPGGLPVGFDQPNPPQTPWSVIDARLTREAIEVINVWDETP